MLLEPPARGSYCRNGEHDVRVGVEHQRILHPGVDGVEGVLARSLPDWIERNAHDIEVQPRVTEVLHAAGELVRQEILVVVDAVEDGRIEAAADGNHGLLVFVDDPGDDLLLVCKHIPLKCLVAHRLVRRGCLDCPAFGGTVEWRRGEVGAEWKPQQVAVNRRCNRLRLPSCVRGLLRGSPSVIGEEFPDRLPLGEECDAADDSAHSSCVHVAEFQAMSSSRRKVREVVEDCRGDFRAPVGM